MLVKVGCSKWQIGANIANISIISDVAWREARRRGKVIRLLAERERLRTAEIRYLT